MLIPVIYQNGKQDMVKDFYLNELISRQEIIRFKRRAGWVDLPSGNIRKGRDEDYSGPERRGQLPVEVVATPGQAATL